MGRGFIDSRKALSRDLIPHRQLLSRGTQWLHDLDHRRPIFLEIIGFSGMGKWLHPIVLFRIMWCCDHHTCTNVIIVTRRKWEHIGRTHSYIDDRRTCEIGSIDKSFLKHWWWDTGIISESNAFLLSHFCECISQSIEEIIIDIDSIDATKIIRTCEEREVHWRKR